MSQRCNGERITLPDGRTGRWFRVGRENPRAMLPADVSNADKGTACYGLGLPERIGGRWVPRHLRLDELERGRMRW